MFFTDVVKDLVMKSWDPHITSVPHMSNSDVTECDTDYTARNVDIFQMFGCGILNIIFICL